MFCVLIKGESDWVVALDWVAGEGDNIKLRVDRQEEACFYHIQSAEHSRQRHNLYFNVCLGVWGTHEELPNIEN